MKIRLLTMICLAGIFSFSCKNNTQKENNELFGSYEGTLPCADCSGIKQKLTLKADHTFVLESTYLGKDETPYVKKGTFKEEDGKVILAIEAPNQYKIEKGFLEQLEQLDISGNEIESNHNYKLTKIAL